MSDRGRYWDCGGKWPKDLAVGGHRLITQKAGGSMPPLVLGLDVGGSKSHATLCEGGRFHSEVFAGSANPSSVGVVEAWWTS
jgi:hypothetical protein